MFLNFYLQLVADPYFLMIGFYEFLQQDAKIRFIDIPFRTLRIMSTSNFTEHPVSS